MPSRRNTDTAGSICVTTLNNTAEVPFWPRVEAQVRPDGSAEVTINGTSYPVASRDIPAARDEVLALVVQRAAVPLGRAVRVDTTDPNGSQWQLIVHPNGHVEDGAA